jgi:hypothetical protein
VTRIGTLALALLLSITALTESMTTASAQTRTYDQFSLMTTRHAGQYWQGGKPAGQWAWSPSPDGSSDVAWGDPAAWPPPTFEHFTHDQNWVYLEGYGDRTTGEFLRQIVTSERFGDGSCQNMTELATPDGRQRYVKWNIPNTAYCLDTTGFLDYRGTRINFRHLQVWSPPSGPTCTTEYYRNKICIKQFEQYWDDNAAPYGLRIWRDQIEALGIGQAFIVHSYLPADHGWEAHLRFDWSY